MRRRKVRTSAMGKIVEYKLDPGVFIVEFPGTKEKVSLGQPPDAVKRFQQVGYAGENGISTFVIADSKTQGDSISWNLIEFPLLYALYFILVKKNGNMIPAFFAGQSPKLVGLERDVNQAMAMMKYSNYGVDSIEELDVLDIPEATREALRKEILGLAVGNEIKDTESFIEPVYLERNPKDENEFSDLGGGIKIGHIAHNLYRFFFNGDLLDVNVSLLPDESYRSPIEFAHLRFPVLNFGIWHTGEHDGMDPYYSGQHTTIIHKYEPLLIDYPSNMTEVINHHGLSNQSIDTIFVTHNHDDHVGGMVELVRRPLPTRVVTTEPVRLSLLKKLSALLDIPEQSVFDSFEWTILPFRNDSPYETEPLNLDGLWVTGHLSCHSVPTTVYTFKLNYNGEIFTYGHFLDITAFKRMDTLVEQGWMPEAHLRHLEGVVKNTPYDLIKYDAGCLSDAGLPFTVHGQWQDLIGAATPRAFRVFTHANRDTLDPAYQQEGRFVSIGDLDSTIRDREGKLLRLGAGVGAITAFYVRSRRAVLSYFLSLVPPNRTAEQVRLMHHYADAFAISPKQPDPNIGTFLFEQGEPSNGVIVLVKGRAEIVQHDEEGNISFRSTIGDGEVVGDLGVLSSQPRVASIKALNRLAYLFIPANLFLEAMSAIGITFEGDFKEIFQRRVLFQSAGAISQDVPTTVLNRIAKMARKERVIEGQELTRKGDRDDQLIIAGGEVDIIVGDDRVRFEGPAVVGECEFLMTPRGQKLRRLHDALAAEDMDVLSIPYEVVRNYPVIVDNIRRLIRHRRNNVYRTLPQIDPVGSG
ncbi:MAG: cyclic nucleotide-binding domain-containing protein [SAR324 cluster bacterium]|nr:cyclic nucleotide-binding domain-containing protein [SAR324 cluster bacterium]